jgi:hypothetical protein
MTDSSPAFGLIGGTLSPLLKKKKSWNLTSQKHLGKPNGF